MNKHHNKHWLREKEYRSLKNLYYSDFYCTRTSTEAEIEERLYSKFWNKFCGHYHTAPKHYRKTLNRTQRSKSKQTLIRELNGYDVSYDDNYKDCSWYW
jgi:hypothetical protein